MNGIMDAIAQAFGDVLGQPAVGVAIRLMALYLRDPVDRVRLVGLARRPDAARATRWSPTSPPAA